MSIKLRVMVPIVIILSVIAGCADKFTEVVEETEKNNSTLVQEDMGSRQESDTNGDGTGVESSLTEEQQDLLAEAESQNANESLKANELESREEVTAQEPVDKEKYIDVNEFAQFISYYFYQYHTGEIKAEIFFDKLHPHFDKNLQNMLPDSVEDQKQTFDILQDKFLEQLPSPIVEYNLTNVVNQSRAEEASMFRRYKMENGEYIYYQSIFVFMDDQWLLYDDGPAPPYEVESKTNLKFN